MSRVKESPPKKAQSFLQDKSEFEQISDYYNLKLPEEVQLRIIYNFMVHISRMVSAYDNQLKEINEQNVTHFNWKFRICEMENRLRKKIADISQGK